MSGHSHWAGIKHKKEEKDSKRGAVFSKLLNAISVAAKPEPNPDFNPRLRTAIEKAREANIPHNNIQKAIKGAVEKSMNLEELVFEAYGPGGAAILIIAITGSHNKTVAEIKKVLSANHGKWAEPGSVRWAFSEILPGKDPEAKFTEDIAPEEKSGLLALIRALHDHEDVQGVYTNLAV
ncbi:MAG: YebC/PmpR family DNA-binding transcriptional regulator [Candidatus Liptonbacteria bacterium]|nr:YebC/PmpR family DNA-binding transcriptional regulator [Candidatus Liptonbacteria bacterium]